MWPLAADRFVIVTLVSVVQSIQTSLSYRSYSAIATSSLDESQASAIVPWVLLVARRLAGEVGACVSSPSVCAAESVVTDSCPLAGARLPAASRAVTVNV